MFLLFAGSCIDMSDIRFVVYSPSKGFYTGNRASKARLWSKVVDNAWTYIEARYAAAAVVCYSRSVPDARVLQYNRVTREISEI